MNEHEQIKGWSDRLNEAIRACPGCIVEHAVVLAETQSTQDAARRVFAGQPEEPIMVVASRQTNGRGQRGSRWDDGDAATLACTCVLPDPAGHTPSRLAVCAGLAVLHAVKERCPSGGELGMKWPNDVVARGMPGDRKIAGVLIEVFDGVTLVGMGINCARRDWPPELVVSAVSIEELGGDRDRCALSCALARNLTRWLGASDEQIGASWAEHDTIVGTHQSFVVNNETINGEVIAIDPLGSIAVRTVDGDRLLPVEVTRNARAAV